MPATHPTLPRGRDHYWTAERLDELRPLLAQGLSHAECGYRLGGLSAQQISSAVSHHHLLPNRHPGCVPAWFGERRDELGRMVNQIPCPRYTALAAHFGCTKNAIAGAVNRHCLKAPPAPRVVIELPEPRCCAWPHGHPGEPGYHYCGAPTVSLGASYCAIHHATAYPQVQKKQEECP
jgi:GcrA cell cycle regulator